MPQVTVYIREEDLLKWKSIEKKSEFMHLVLTGKILRAENTIKYYEKSTTTKGEESAGKTDGRKSEQEVPGPKTKETNKTSYTKAINTL